MKQDFVFVQDDLSLSHAVQAVLDSLGPERQSWSRYHILFRREGRYECIPLTLLSGELEQRAWTPATLLAEFDSMPCAVRTASGPLGSALYIVTEVNGRPTELDLIGPPRIGANRTGWWRLVGACMAAWGERPTWPEPLPEGIRRTEIVHIEPQITLRELGERLSALPKPDEAMLAVRQGEGWATCPVKGLADLLMSKRPRPSADSQVGAFLRDLPAAPGTVERSQTPWELVQELLNASPSARLLVAEEGQAAHILSQERVMRGGPETALVSKGIPPSNEPYPLTPKSPARPAGSLTEFLAQLARTTPGKGDYGRVVNTWFAGDPKRPILPTCALAANRPYLFGVNVGEKDARAHVVGEQPAISAQVVRYAVEQGIPLTLRLDSEDFVLLDREQIIELPAAGTTEEVFFRLATPVQTGLSQLRLRLYLKNNLVQSYQVYARVAPAEGPMPEGAGDGWWTRCEYTLSTDFTNLNDLQPRRVCMWMGEGRQGMRRAGLSEATGIDMGAPLAVNAGLIEGALSRYRELLMQITVQEGTGGDQYLYRPDQTPLNSTTFERGIKDLAELGQALYDRLFGERNGREVAERMRQIERMETIRQSQPGPLVVQIARLSLDATFPWAVLYDRPLRYNPRRNTVCMGFLNGPGCQADCPNADDPNALCPYGFWGLRYIIEQPLRPPDAFTSAVVRLRAEHRPRLALVYGTGLTQTVDHRQRIEAIAGEEAERTVHDSTDGLLESLRAAPPTTLYFYCHGGNTPYRHWLVIQEGDLLTPTHLDDELLSVWTQSAPLVVLNGCHTGKYDPSTLLSFIHRFGALGAAGVIGTEVPIHESLGRSFGEFWLAHFLKGEPVGQIVHDFRQELLKKQNLLGLVYVPYCYADLHLDRGGAHG